MQTECEAQVQPLNYRPAEYTVLVGLISHRGTLSAAPRLLSLNRDKAPANEEAHRPGGKLRRSSPCDGIPQRPITCSSLTCLAPETASGRQDPKLPDDDRLALLPNIRKP